MVLCYASMWTYTKDISYVTYAILPYETNYFNPKYDLLLKLNNYFLCFNITNHRFSSVIYNLCIGWGKKNLFQGRNVTNLRKNYRIEKYSHKTAQTITMMTKFWKDCNTGEMCLQLLCFYSATHVPTQFICQEDATALIFRKSGSICPGANQTWHICKLKAPIICWHETKLGVITVVLSWWVRRGFEVVCLRLVYLNFTASLYSVHLFFFHQRELNSQAAPTMWCTVFSHTSTTAGQMTQMRIW